ncbi:MAG: hypothetical protein ACLVCA_02775 [Peptoniphilus sp.]|uniref:hypothetical protein n=1 Tax=Peptoniphilus sp. TaxID=1971214 RepID=UPI0039996E58
MIEKKLNDFLNVLRRQYYGEVFYLNDCGDHYEVLMTNRALIEDKSFDDYFFKLAYEYFCEDAYKIYTSLDYLNEIPEDEKSSRLNYSSNLYLTKEYDIKVLENEKIEDTIYLTLEDIKVDKYESNMKFKPESSNEKNNMIYNDNKLLEVA